MPIIKTKSSHIYLLCFEVYFTAVGFNKSLVKAIITGHYWRIYFWICIMRPVKIKHKMQTVFTPRDL